MVCGTCSFVSTLNTPGGGEGVVQGIPNQLERCPHHPGHSSCDCSGLSCCLHDDDSR